MKRLLLLVLLATAVVPQISLAEGLSVRPFLIDKSMSPRESATETIKIKSDYPYRKAIVFATVNEITVGTDGDIKEFISPVMTDRKTTVTSWIEIQRGRIEVPAGEEVEVPLTINVHPYAEPGEYHVFIGLVESKKRDAAEKIALAGEADGVIVKVTIEDERVESMRVASMQVDRFVTDPDTQNILVTVENPGELTSAPSGELVFYNSRGIEIAATRVNEEGATVPPGGERTFAVKVPFENDIGRFKANLNLQYGANQAASLYDTTSFFMVPLWYLILFGVGVLLLIVLFTILFRRAMVATQPSEHGDEVVMYVRDGHNPNPQDHDIDLSKNK